MINLIALLIIVSLTMHIAKSAEPIYLFLKKKVSVFQEKKKIEKQRVLFEIRWADLLAAGFKYQVNSSRGPHFIKGNAYITQDRVKGISDLEFKRVLHG